MIITIPHTIPEPAGDVYSVDIWDKRFIGPEFHRPMIWLWTPLVRDILNQNPNAKVRCSCGRVAVVLVGTNMLTCNCGLLVVHECRLIQGATIEGGHRDRHQG